MRAAATIAFPTSTSVTRSKAGPGECAAPAETARPLLWRSLQSLARILTTVLFDLKVTGIENIPTHGGALVVSNHQGYIDPVALGARQRRPLNYIGKSELFGNRWGAWLLKALNAFPVRQGKGDVGAIKETIRRLREGQLLNYFPEGQRTLDGKIGPLLGGVAVVIRRAKVPVIPAVIIGSYEAWPVHRSWFRRHPVHVHFGPPLDLTGRSSEHILAVLDNTLHTMFDDLNNRQLCPERRQTPRLRIRRWARETPARFPHLCGATSNLIRGKRPNPCHARVQRNTQAVPHETAHRI
jgi:1-acyl-sn-glycerol-3-phosphate acyltransferase